MPRYKQLPPLLLSDMISEGVPRRMRDEIKKMELTIDEWLEWESKKPKVQIVMTEKELFFAWRGHLTIKKTHAIIVSIMGFLVAAGPTIYHYISPAITLLNGR